MHGCKRRYNPVWGRTWKWAVYSIAFDGIICVPRALFCDLKERHSKRHVVNTPFRSWQSIPFMIPLQSGVLQDVWILELVSCLRFWCWGRYMTRLLHGVTITLLFSALLFILISIWKSIRNGTIYERNKAGFRGKFSIPHGDLLQSQSVCYPPHA